jgi:hypothetical protein
MVEIVMDDKDRKADPEDIKKANKEKKMPTNAPKNQAGNEKRGSVNENVQDSLKRPGPKAGKPSPPPPPPPKK